VARIEDLTWLAARETMDDAKVALGEMIAELREWDLFGTMTYDQRRRLMEPIRVRAWARGEIQRPVPGDEAKKNFFRWIGEASGAVGRRIEFVCGMEYQKNGWPHFHALLDLGGLDDGDAVRIGRLWYARYGYDRLEIPRSLGDCARYAAKYLVKDISLGDVLFSKRLAEPLDVVQRRLPGQCW
jgi:hypothetical protein